MAKEDYTVENMEGLLVGELGMTLAGDLNELEDRERIDLKTPGYKSKMEKELSKQQRKILISMAREGKPLRVREVAVVSRMFQQNACSSQLGRMITKGFLGMGPVVTQFESCIKDYLELQDKLNCNLTCKLIGLIYLEYFHYLILFHKMGYFSLEKFLL